MKARKRIAGTLAMLAAVATLTLTAASFASADASTALAGKVLLSLKVFLY